LRGLLCLCDHALHGIEIVRSLFEARLAFVETEAVAITILVGKAVEVFGFLFVHALASHIAIHQHLL